MTIPRRGIAVSFYPPSTNTGSFEIPTANTPVRLTTDATAAVTPLKNGIIVTQSADNDPDAEIYWKNGSSGARMLLTNPGQISPASVKYIGDIWFDTNTSGSVIYCEIVGQTVTISA